MDSEEGRSKWICDTLAKLCTESLKKWDHGSLLGINDKCPFCHNTDTTNKYGDFRHHCSNCICPPKICINNANSGFINELQDIYGFYRPIKDMDEEHIDKMRAMFEEYI